MSITPKKQHEILKQKLVKVDVENNQIEYDLKTDERSANILSEVTGELKGRISWRCSDSNCKIYVDRKYGGSPFRGTVPTSLSEDEFAAEIEEVLKKANCSLNRDFL